MATDLERLVVQLSADIKGYENAMRRAQGITTRQTRQIEGAFARANRNLQAGFVGLAKGFAGAFAGAAAITAAQKLIDASTRINNALKVAGLSGEELSRVYDRLFESAQRNATPIEALVELYSRASLSAKELGISQEELLNFTDKIAVALRVNGQSAAESSGALLQLAQALGSGVVRAEEFNSVQEGALPILQAVAAGLEEAGGSVAKLRQLVIDGKVSSEAFFRAFEAGSSILDQKVAGAELTVSQGFVRLTNVLIKVAGQFNEATGASNAAGAALGRLSSAVETFGGFLERAANGPLGRFVGWLGELDAKAKAVLETLARFSLVDEGIAALGSALAPEGTGPDNVRVASGKTAAVQGPIDRRIDAAFVASSGGTVSLRDFKLPGSDKDKKARENDLAREIRQIQERTAALQAETAAMAGLNPLINDYGFALEKARAQQELLAAAEKEKIAITPELRAQIEGLATAYASTVVEAERLAEAQDLTRERVQEMADLARDSLGGFISDLRNGVSAADALNNALNRIADTLINQVLDALFQINGAGGGGILGSLIGGLLGGNGTPAFAPVPAPRPFAAGGYTGSGGKYQPKGVVHGGEFVFSKEATARAGVGNLAALHRSLKGYAEGGFVAPTMPRLGAANQNGGSTVNIVMNNAPPNRQRETRSRDARGEIRTIVFDFLNEGIATGAADKSFGARFGAQPMKTVR